MSASRTKPPAPGDSHNARALEPPSPGLWFCNWKIWLDARRRLDQAFAPLGIKSRDFYLLSIAGSGDLSQQHMAQLCGIDPSSLVPIIDGLEKRGWLRRVRNPKDRRMQWVQRTEEGEVLFQRALPKAQLAETQQLATLSEAHQRQLIRAMRQLVTALTQERETA